MDAYRRVLSIPGTAAVLLLGLLARIPFSTLGLLLTLHAVLTLERSYFEAGLIVAASTIGTTVSSPWRGRLLDRYGLRRAVIPSIVIQPLALIAASLATYEVLVLIAFMGGMFSLPVWAIVRTSLSVLVPASLRRSAFALDSMTTELVFMAGPAAITIAALAISTQVCLVIVAGLIALAGIGLLIADPPTRSDQVMLPTKLPPALAASEGAAAAQKEGYAEQRVAEDLTTGQIPVVDAQASASARAALLSLGGMAALIATAIGSTTITATDLSLVAILEGAGSTGLIAPIMTVWCAGSLVGGFAYGAARRTIGPLWVLLALGLLSIPVGFVHNPWLLGVAVFGAGLALAPIITATSEFISRRVSEEVRGEAMGWHGSAMTIGAAVGSPLFGAVIDGLGPAWGVGAAALLATGVAAAGLIATGIRRAHRRRVLQGRFGEVA
ncbi:MFS transporter [Brachybacterium epidermidis]|uniref:MFS transporter n=1 Tax=Brachybacterium epidermidis TaxID=2781983 RepID=UPI00398E66BC